MTELYQESGALPYIPDDLNLTHFMLGYCERRLRQVREDVPCLVESHSGRKIYIEEMRKRTYALASMLQSIYNIGSNENDIVFFSSPNHIDYPIVLWAVLLLGGIISCSNPSFSIGEVSSQLEISQASFIIGHSCNLDILLSAAHQVGISSDRVIIIDSSALLNHPNKPVSVVLDLIRMGLQGAKAVKERFFVPGEGKKRIALLPWSSGTTGKPKAVAISHYALIANIIQMATHQRIDNDSSSDLGGYRPGDVAIGVLPFYHVAGLVISLHFTLFCNMSVVVVEKYNIITMLESIMRHQITHLIIVPPIALDLCKHPATQGHDLVTVRHIVIGAAPVARGVQQQLCELFPEAQIGQIYGLTEMTTTLAMLSPTQKRGVPGSGGRLLPGIQARVVKADGSPATYNEPGELVVKGPAAALYYLNDEASTKTTFVDGWVRTGDLVLLSEKWEVFVVDRLKEMMKVKGHSVAPAELEECILSHPDVLDCCVVGVPDQRHGEMPMAYVTLTSCAKERSAANATEERESKNDIIKHVADRMVSYKRLRGGVQVIENIPRNGSGKILRRQLRQMAEELSDHQRPRARM